MTDAQDDDLEKYRGKCTRWLTGHGDRSAAQLLASIPAELGVDRYGEGGAVTALEDEVRTLLGKPAAAFFPSGTMAQMAAMRVHADRRKLRTIAFHPTCHLELHEDKAYQRLHGLVGRPVGNAWGLITLDDLRAVKEPLAAVLFELPQREIGGLLPQWEDLGEQVEYVRASGAAVHLDGARLWESTPFYGKAPAEIAARFDTVYVSFYKGLGGLAGACLAGEEEVIAEARLWRKRHGGTLFGMWPNAAAGLAGLRERLPLMPEYVAHARAIAEKLREVPGVEIVPDPPHTNMFRMYVKAEDPAFRIAACRIAREQGVWTFARTMAGPMPSTRVVEFTVGDATLAFEPGEVAEMVARLTASA